MANEAFAIGQYTRLFIEPGTTTKAGSSGGGGLTFDANSETYHFLSESMTRKRPIIGGQEIRGTRKPHQIRTRFGPNSHGGEITKHISPGELDLLLKYFAGDESTDVFDPDDALPYFDLMLYRDATVFAAPGSSNFKYWDCKCDKFILRGKADGEGEPQLVTATMRIIACHSGLVAVPSGYPATPALPTGLTFEPYVFADSDSFVIINSTTCPIEEFVLVCDNMIEAKYVNSQDPYALKETDRQWRMRLKVVWNDTTDAIRNQAKAGSAASFKLANGSYSTLFNFSTLQIDDVDPCAADGKGQLRYIIDATARAAASDAYETRITNVVS